MFRIVVGLDTERVANPITYTPSRSGGGPGEVAEARVTIIKSILRFLDV